ncbi:hypothetical protein ACWDF6_23770, partial [Streptomyces sp. NPDC001155]
MQRAGVARRVAVAVGAGDGGLELLQRAALGLRVPGADRLRRPSWWGALALNGLGGVLHVVALAYGPLSLV